MPSLLKSVWYQNQIHVYMSLRQFRILIDHEPSKSFLIVYSSRFALLFILTCTEQDFQRSRVCRRWRTVWFRLIRWRWYRRYLGIEYNNVVLLFVLWSAFLVDLNWMYVYVTKYHYRKNCMLQMTNFFLEMERGLVKPAIRFSSSNTCDVFI